MLHLSSSTAAADWLRARGAHALRTDHRQVRPGDAFLAWPGRSHDARRHAGSALAAGAAACLMEGRELAQVVLPADDERLACLDDLKRQAGVVADEFWGHPSQALDVVAVTGTNGKTSCTWWVAQALTLLGRRCGVVGTLGVGDPFTSAAGDSAAPAGASAFASTGLTTPDAVALQAAFRQCANGGLKACAIEASSIGIVEHRLAGTALSVAAFTNLTQDHLDYHGTMAAYGAAKRALFDMPGLKAAVLNVNDAQGRAWAAELATQPGLALWTVSVQAPEEGLQASVDASPIGAVPSTAVPPVAATDPAVLAATHLYVRQVRHTPEGLDMLLCEQGSAGMVGQVQAVRTPLIGAFNVENLLVVAGCLRALGIPLEEVARVLGQLSPVPGRLQRVSAAGVAAQPAVVVDYAHTPDALDKALQALAPLAAARGGQLWCVFGCGGDRDATKRPLMGRVAVQGAAHTVVTSDNPRSEDPARILAQVMEGAREHLQAARETARESNPKAALEAVAPLSLTALADRRAAIQHAVWRAAPADVVLIAGKGHEQTQEIAGQKHPFCDVAEAAAALAQRAGGTQPTLPAEVQP
jgi:UDP-N-acetylmuramoyl-L-alanyl-D-glutamate--2,6-diaminopimelate ligase